MKIDVLSPRLDAIGRMKLSRFGGDPFDKLSLSSVESTSVGEDFLLTKCATTDVKLVEVKLIIVSSSFILGKIRFVRSLESIKIVMY